MIEQSPPGGQWTACETPPREAGPTSHKEVASHALSIGVYDSRGRNWTIDEREYYNSVAL